MKLLTKAIENSLPSLGKVEAQEDPLVLVKYFCPWNSWTWYGLEFDPMDRIFFGYVEGFENELGNFSLDELEELEGPMGLKIERDLYFKPVRLSELRK